MIEVACESCPFAFTDESEMVQNYGCLPTPHEIVEMKRECGHNWACHSNEKKLCAGFKEFIENRQKSPYFIEKYDDIDTSKGGLIPYEVWYHEGREAAMQKADENFKEGKSQLILIIPYDMEWDGEENIHYVGFSTVFVDESEEKKGKVKFTFMKSGYTREFLLTRENGRNFIDDDSQNCYSRPISLYDVDLMVNWYLKAKTDERFGHLLFEERSLNTKNRCR